MYAAVFSETSLDDRGWTAVYNAINYTDYARELLDVWGLKCDTAIFSLYVEERQFAYIKLVPTSAYEVGERRAVGRVYKGFTVINREPHDFCLRLHFLPTHFGVPPGMKQFEPRFLIPRESA